MTGGLDEVQIGAIAEMGARLAELEKRKSTIIATITEQGKMTPELRHAIDSCNDANTLEDIYLPYKPRRRTRAQAAREKGLEPLAEFIMRQRDGNPRDEASRYVKGDVADADEALQGALDIIAEEVSETARARDIVRSSFRRDAVITSKAVKAKVATEEAANYAGYFDFSCPLRRCASHQLLAMRRGESEGCLRVSVAPASDDEPVGRLERLFVRGRSAASSLVAEAVGDAYKRLLRPSIESESQRRKTLRTSVHTTGYKIFCNLGCQGKEKDRHNKTRLRSTGCTPRHQHTYQRIQRPTRFRRLDDWLIG